jgi:sec-independent protein translocase protein TatB
MFDPGLPELVLVFVLALLILGPERLPRVATQIGRWIGKARRTATQLRRQLEREIELEELAKVARNQPKPKPKAAPNVPADAAPNVPAEAAREDTPAATTGDGESSSRTDPPEAPAPLAESGTPSEERAASDERA